MNDEDKHSEEDEHSEAKQAEEENDHDREQGKQKEMRSRINSEVNRIRANQKRGIRSWEQKKKKTKTNEEKDKTYQEALLGIAELRLLD